MLCVSSLGAEESRRFWELSIFPFELGVSNTFFRIDEIFKQTLEINTKDVSDNGLLAAARGHIDLLTLAFYNLQPWELRFFIGGDVFFAGEISQGMLDFFYNDSGRAGTFDGSILVGGSAFAELGASVVRRFGRWRFEVMPAFYIPVLYIPQSEINYHLDNKSSGISVDVDAHVAVYSAIPVQDGSMSFEFDSFLESWGVDLGLGAEYELFSFLDLGARITHIPVYPAHLRNKFYFDADYTIVDADLIDLFDLEAFETTSGTTSSNFLAFRPLYLDLYAGYRPLNSDLITLIPMAGISTLTVYGYGKIIFNAGIEGRLHYPGFLTTSLGTSYRDRIWKHKLGFSFGFKVFSLDLGFALEAPKLLASFSAKGLGLSLGMRFHY